MMKYESNIGPSLIIAFVLLAILGTHAAFAKDTRPKKWEYAPFIEFEGTAHGGLGKHYDGLSLGAGIGGELLYAFSDRFAIGGVASTSAVYDAYNDFEGDGCVIDEYWIWAVSVGGIMYVGDTFYASIQMQYNLDVFYSSTYRHSGTTDTDLEKLDYTVDDLDWRIEAGFRVDYHAAVYIAANTHLVETEMNTSRYQMLIGVKFFF